MAGNLRRSYCDTLRAYHSTLYLLLFIKRISYITISSITARILWPSVALWPTRATPDVCAAFTDDTRAGKSLKILSRFASRPDRFRKIDASLWELFICIYGLSTMFVSLILKNDFVILRMLITLKLNRSFQANFFSSISFNFVNQSILYFYLFFSNYSSSIFL